MIRPTLGPLHPEHRAQVEEVVRSTGVFSEGEVAVALELFDDAGSDYRFVGAFDSKRLIGYACFGPTPSTDRTYDLYWIAVRPDSRGGGVGRALMEEVERQLTASSGRMIVVETSSRDDYESTRRFYDRLGYTESARLRDFYAPGDARVVLTRKLPQVSGPATA